jgi:hypothetical protein
LLHHRSWSLPLFILARPYRSGHENSSSISPKQRSLSDSLCLSFIEPLVVAHLPSTSYHEGIGIHLDGARLAIWEFGKCLGSNEPRAINIRSNTNTGLQLSRRMSRNPFTRMLPPSPASSALSYQSRLLRHLFQCCCF